MTLAVNRAIDPTRTVTLRNEFRRFYGAAWLRVGTRAQELAREAARFDTPFDRLQYFNNRIGYIVDEEMRNAENDAGHGIRALAMAAYLRGMKQADADARVLDVEIYDEPRDAIRRRDHNEELAALLLLLLLDFRGMNDNALARLRAAYSAAIMGGGNGISEIGEATRTTASNNVTGFVSTGVVRAFNNGILGRFAQIGVLLVGGLIEQQFTTAGDSRVCPLCLALEQQDNGRGPGVFTLAQAAGVIPVHRRCRCRWRGVSR